MSDNDDSIKQQTIIEASADVTLESTGVIENSVFDFENDDTAANAETPGTRTLLLRTMGTAAKDGTLTISNCTLIDSYDVSYQWSGVDTVIIENCTFVGSRKWAVAIGHNNTQYIVRNNVFYNCERGINFQECASSNGATVIENNTFILTNTSKSKAFQFANYTNEALEKVSDVCVIIRNNTVQSAVGVVNVHETMVQKTNSDNSQIRTGVVNLVDLETTGTARGKNGEQTFTFTAGTNAGNYQNLVRFENNNTSAVSVKVTPDIPDCAFDGICEKYMTTMVNYYNSIFQ